MLSLSKLFVALSVSLCLSQAAYAAEIHLSEKEASDIGLRVWQNECSRSIKGLTSWNVGENFPSLGIAHFIWYPEGSTDPFEESFPKLLVYLKSVNVKMPVWLTPETKCPWTSREEFLNDLEGQKMLALRGMLMATIPQQTKFLVMRVEAALPKIFDKCAPENRDKIKRRFETMLKQGAPGAFALIDYVNFKGEGVNEKERYKREGWGLLQVLEGMKDTKLPLTDFADSAESALKRRVKNSPPERHEERWLRGWTRRVREYAG